MEKHLQILDLGLTLRGPREVIEPIAFAYRRFSVADAGANAVILEVDSEMAESARVGDRVFDLVPELEVSLQMYQFLLKELMDRIGSHAMLHAAALRTRAGEAIVLAAPSGHGKTSLTLELAHRGLGFMGDDYAPLDLERRSIAPYPRAVALLPDGSAPIPSPFRDQLATPQAVRMFGKTLLDVGQVLGEESMVKGPLPLRHVVLLTAGEDDQEPETTRVLVAGRARDADELQALFTETAGVEIVERVVEPHLSVWNLRLVHEAAPTKALAAVLDSDKVLFSEKRWDARPDFGGRPAAAMVRKREAAELLGREILNRRSGGRLLGLHDNDVTSLYLHVAGALRDTVCWRVCVGEYSQTADLIESICR